MNIFVTGDLIIDTNIARLQSILRSYRDDCPVTLEKQEYGGAWYIHYLLDIIAKKMTKQLQVRLKSTQKQKQENEDKLNKGGHKPEQEKLLKDEIDSNVNQIKNIEQAIEALGNASISTLHTNKTSIANGKALSLWELFDVQNCQKDKGNKCWRISEFLGCQRLGWQARLKEEEFRQYNSCDAIVIDDVGVGFSDDQEIWKSEDAQQAFEKAKTIIGKTTTLNKPLWKYLLKEHAQKLTLVTTADAIREISGPISRGLSWDKTIQQIQKEFSQGMVGDLLGRCSRIAVLFGIEGIANFTSQPRCPHDEVPKGQLVFEQFIYSPNSMEGDIALNCPGIMIGKLSILTAAMTASELFPKIFPRFNTSCQCLKAIEYLYNNGAGKEQKEPKEPQSLIEMMEIPTNILVQVEMPEEKLPQYYLKPENSYGVGYPRELLDEGMYEDKDSEQTLLTDICGNNNEYIIAKAKEIALIGPEKALPKVPYAKYGNYTTYDKEEIESINSLKNLILEYLSSKHTRPLCIAVFGQPGSGKSFAIKQLAKSLFKGKQSEITFNLSQFEAISDLYAAFHQVRDMALQGNVPLVFWDEFDSSQNSNPLIWLKEFLAPMQDGEFNEAGRNHPIGRSIFIFAGGTANSFDEFNNMREAHKAEKAPDFISRLRGYLNVKGPNPVTSECPDDKSSANENSISNNDKESNTEDVQVDRLYPIRRALLLHNFIRRYFGNNTFVKSGNFTLSPEVISGLLTVSKYHHGARSLEAVVSHSHLHQAGKFNPSLLPPDELLKIHLKDDFFTIMESTQQQEYDKDNFIQQLAECIHEKWKRTREKQSWTWGSVRNDEKKTHPLLKPYSDLTIDQKYGNIRPAENLCINLTLLGYAIVSSKSKKAAGQKRFTSRKSFGKNEQYMLAKVEHQRWMREKMREGCIWGQTTNENNRVLNFLQKFEHLDNQTASLDFGHIDALFETLKQNNLILIRQEDK